MQSRRLPVSNGGIPLGIALGLCVGGFLSDHTALGTVAGFFSLLLLVGTLATLVERGDADLPPSPAVHRARQAGRDVMIRIDGRWRRPFGARRRPDLTLPDKVPERYDDHGDYNSLPFRYAVTVVPRDAPAYRTMMTMPDNYVLRFPLNSVHYGVRTEEGFPDVSVLMDDRTVWDGPAFPPWSRDLPVYPPRRRNLDRRAGVRNGTALAGTVLAVAVVAALTATVTVLVG